MATSVLTSRDYKAGFTVSGGNVTFSGSTYLDLGKVELRNAKIQNLAADPSTPTAGQIYYNTGDNTLRYYNGGSFVTLTTGSTVSYGSPVALTVGGANSDGVATALARADHVHALPNWGAVTAETTYGASSSNGVATTFARSDHTHGNPALPSASAVGAVANGGNAPYLNTGANASRPATGYTAGRLYVDTTNNVIWLDNGTNFTTQLNAFAAPSASAVGDAQGAGSAYTYARSDHVHAREAFGAVTAQTSYGSASGNGSASTVARSDHTHGTPSLSSNVASTQAIGDAATNGTGTLPAKDDHKHAMPSFGLVAAMGAANSFGGSNAVGTAATLSRVDHVHALPAHDAAAHSGISISNLAAATGTYSFGANLVQSSATPAGANDLTNKSYVDSIAAGLRDFKDSVRVATTAAGTLATSFANGQTVDGIALVTGDRILIKNQASAAENGIYVVAASGAPTRATDADATGEISTGTLVYVESGTQNGGQQWVCTATGATPWTTASSSTWSLYFAVTSTQAGAGLTASGNVLAVGAGTGISVAADAVAVDTAVVGRKYTATCAATTNPQTFNHALANQWVQVQVIEVATLAQVECDVTLTDANNISVNFGGAPTAAQYRVIVQG